MATCAYFLLALCSHGSGESIFKDEYPLEFEAKVNHLCNAKQPVYMKKSKIYLSEGGEKLYFNQTTWSHLE